MLKGPMHTPMRRWEGPSWQGSWGVSQHTLTVHAVEGLGENPRLITNRVAPRSRPLQLLQCVSA